MGLSLGNILGSLLSGLVVGIAFTLSFGLGVGLIAGGLTFGASMLVSLLEPQPKSEIDKPKPYKLDDFQFPSVSRFTVLPRIYGEYIFSGYYVHIDNLISEEVKQSQHVDTGKGGGGGQDVSFTVGYNYYADCFMIFCEEPVFFVGDIMNQSFQNIARNYLLTFCYTTNKDYNYNRLPTSFKQKVFKWYPITSLFIKKCFLGFNVRTFPAIFIRVRDTLFEYVENDDLKNYSYVIVDSDKPEIKSLRTVNCISVLLSLLCESVFGYKELIANFYNEIFLSSEKVKALLQHFYEKRIVINTIINQIRKTSDLIRKIQSLISIKIETIDTENFPFKIEIINIDHNKLNILPDSDDKYNVIDNVNSENIIDDFITISCRKSINYNEAKVSVGYDCNKRTFLYFSTIDKNSYNRKSIDLDYSEFYYTDGLYELLNRQINENIGEQEIIDCIIPIEKIENITAGSIVKLKYKPMRIIGVYQVEEINYRTDGTVRLQLKKI